MAFCSRRPSKFEKALETVSLTPQQKAVLQNRYIPMIRHMRYRARRLTIGFYVGHTIITVGSLIVPALLSIQYASTPSTLSSHQQAISEQIYWATWIISLFVTICNGLVTLYKVDKHYYFIHTTMEHLTSEGWQYISLTSKYSGFHTPGVSPTHDNQFIHFCHAIEKIRMRQIEEEYYKVNDKHAQETTNGAAVATAAAAGAEKGGGSVGEGGLSSAIVPKISSTAFIPPTPLKGDLAAVPAQYRRAAQLAIASIQENFAEAGVDGANTEAQGPKTSPTAQQDKETKENGTPGTVSV